MQAGEKLVNETFGPNNIRRRTSGTADLHEMDIADGRALASEFSLEVNGFELVAHRTAVKNFFEIEPRMSKLNTRAAALQEFQDFVAAADNGGTNSVNVMLDIASSRP